VLHKEIVLPKHARTGGSVTDSAPAMAILAVPFLGLVNELASILTPVKPARAFRRDLGDQLVASARQQRAYQNLVGDSGSHNEKWLWWGAAAVGSAISVAGVVALVVTRRHHLTA
jgi:hypothetical protein